MAIFYRGAGVGTYWHTNDPRVTGFTPHSPGMPPSPDRLKEHIARGTITSPYVTLTKSYGVAESYARNLGRVAPTEAVPAYVWEIEINDPVPPNLQLIDPVQLIANNVPLPLAPVPYQHNGPPTCLIALIDATQHALLTKACPTPPNSNPPPKYPIITTELQAMIFALRDAEILVFGTIPPTCVRHRYPVV